MWMCTMWAQKTQVSESEIDELICRKAGYEWVSGQTCWTGCSGWCWEPLSENVHRQPKDGSPRDDSHPQWMMKRCDQRAWLSPEQFLCYENYRWGHFKKKIKTRTNQLKENRGIQRKNLVIPATPSLTKQCFQLSTSLCTVYHRNFHERFAWVRRVSFWDSGDRYQADSNWNG